MGLMYMSNPVIDTFGNKEWRNVDGVVHREDGPAIEWANGSKEWCLNGQRHREDGPAVELANGSKAWWLNDKLHREDGPAIEWANGTNEWWLNGKQYTEEEYVMIQFMNGVNVYADNC